MNASGRLDTAKRALELLRAKNEKEADLLAGDLKALNESRKELTEKAVLEAIELIETTDVGKDKVLVIYLPECHESLAGIVAGRVRERYYKPTYVLTDTEDGAKGSGRSIDAYHMYEELNKCKQLFTRFGGHKLAAGLSLERKNVPEFRRMINELCELKDEDLYEKVSIDMQLPFSCITERFVEELSLLEPFGKGNTKPVFAEKDVEILNAKRIGKQQNMLRMQVKDGAGTLMDALYFGDADQFLNEVSKKYGTLQAQNLFKGKAYGVRMAFTYYPGINEFRGNRSPQIVITHYQ